MIFHDIFCSLQISQLTPAQREGQDEDDNDIITKPHNTRENNLKWINIVENHTCERIKEHTEKERIHSITVLLLLEYHIIDTK